MRVTSASVPDIGRSLRKAREQSGLTVDEAASRAGLGAPDIEGLESGTVGRLRDRVETLRSLRVYADSLGLPGNDYALAVIDLWPARSPDSGQVPVVSVTTAPPNGHSPGAGTGWPDRTGATDFSVTGVVPQLGGLPMAEPAAAEAGRDPIVDTGELPAVKQGASRWLKVLVGSAAVLVAFGIFTLIEHAHFASWNSTVQADASRWWQDLKVSTGLASKKPAQPAAAPAGTLPVVAMVQNPAASSVTVNVHAATFNVKMVAFKGSSWMQVTDSHQVAPVYQQVMAAGGNQVFAVTHSITIETGSTAARAYLYDGTQFIGYFFPTKAPYTMTFNAVG
jgi:hypothetical protein